MDVQQLKEKAIAFQNILDKKKLQIEGKTFWYPYCTLNNFVHLDSLLGKGKYRSLLDLAENKVAADIGAADGDTAFFLETLGFKVDVIDYAPTNFNNMRGVRLLKDAMSSSVGIYDIDLDSQFTLPKNRYELIFFLGILYHLKNPYYALEALARSCRYCLISTKVAKLSTDKKINFSELPIAYLVDKYEANNDPTNYWVFSNSGLRRILDRTGWEICEYKNFGNTINSDPATPEGDERAFCLVRSRIFR